MANIFFIGDTHLGHARLLTFETSSRHSKFSCIEEHDEYIVDNWNKTVRTKDVVYHLGDVELGNPEFIARLKGDKKLVMGNHDKFSRIAQYFTNFYGAKIVHGYLLTHIPVNPQQLEFRFKYNIHGHIHDGLLEDARYINVACEQINYTPICIEDINKKI